MADYDSAEPPDLVNMSKELNIEDRGGRNSSRGGKFKPKGQSSHGGRSGGGSGGGGGKEMNREVAVSKALSKLLRHAAVDAGLALDGEGFARLDQVVSLNFPFLIPSYWEEEIKKLFFDVICLLTT
jgi:2'-phosphotransferase